MFFKQKTAYEMRISDWSSDVCSSELHDMPATLEDETLTFLLDAKRLGKTRFIGASTHVDGAEQALALGVFDSVMIDYNVDRKSVVEGKSVAVRVGLGGHGLMKQKKRHRDKTRIVAEKRRLNS